MKQTGAEDKQENAGAAPYHSAALLAIHSAISYSDALRSALGDEKISGEDHQKAAHTLLKLLPSSVRDRDGIEHFRRLLAKKSRVAYAAERFDRNDALALVTAAERFAAWVNRVGRQQNLKGWRTDDL